MMEQKKPTEWISVDPKTWFSEIVPMKQRITELEDELSTIRSTRMNCVKDGKCQHCGVEAPYCYHATVADYSQTMRRVAELEAVCPAYRRHIVALEAALREIAEHPHCGAECWRDPIGNISMETGHTLGHRCAAEIAKRMLEK